jgi:hypothetical protein
MITSLVILLLAFLVGFLLTQKGVPLSAEGLAGTLLSFFSHVTSSLLALMTILAQSLLTLVCSHLVALLFLSVWHNSRIYLSC